MVGFIAGGYIKRGYKQCLLTKVTTQIEEIWASCGGSFTSNDSMSKRATYVAVSPAIIGGLWNSCEYMSTICHPDNMHIYTICVCVYIYLKYVYICIHNCHRYNYIICISSYTDMPQPFMLPVLYLKARFPCYVSLCATVQEKILKLLIHLEHFRCSITSGSLTVCYRH